MRTRAQYCTGAWSTQRVLSSLVQLRWATQSQHHYEARFRRPAEEARGLIRPPTTGPPSCSFICDGMAVYPIAKPALHEALALVRMRSARGRRGRRLEVMPVPTSPICLWEIGED